MTHLYFPGICKWEEVLPVQAPHAGGESEYTSHLWRRQHEHH